MTSASPSLTWVDSLLRSPSEARLQMLMPAPLTELIPISSGALSDTVPPATASSAVTLLPRGAPPLIDISPPRTFTCIYCERYFRCEESAANCMQSHMPGSSDVRLTGGLMSPCPTDSPVSSRFAESDGDLEMCLGKSTRLSSLLCQTLSPIASSPWMTPGAPDPMLLHRPGPSAPPPGLSWRLPSGLLPGWPIRTRPVLLGARPGIQITSSTPSTLCEVGVPLDLSPSGPFAMPGEIVHSPRTGLTEPASLARAPSPALGDTAAWDVAPGLSAVPAPSAFHLGLPPFPPWRPRCGPAGNLPMLGDYDDEPPLIGDLAPIGTGPVAPPPPSPGDDPPGEPTDDDADWDDGVPPAIFPDDRLLFLGDAGPSFFQQKWIDIFINISSIKALDDQITIYTAELQQALRRPARRGRRRRPPVTAAVPPILADALGRQRAQTSAFFNNGLAAYDKEAATKLQRDFNLMPGRTVDSVLNGGREPCPIPAERLVAHFGEVYSSRPHSHEFVFSDYSALDPASNEVLVSPYSKEEVWRKLLNTSNSAPGPDLIPYSILKAKDPGALILTTICRAVQIFGVVPDAWRKANIVLVHKAGDRDDVSNWRPIALLNTMGKVFSGCLADRLDDWGNKNPVLSPQQKGFREFEGCLEHNFLIQHMLSRARSSKSELFLAWLDLENAFGAVPHSLILEGLTHIKVPPSKSSR
ncbi:hypothetical protein JTE90_004007 [Oedothorax gibbosus]|uniref:Reverse transcriptase domain-containing protein n=1 Tax=Oedothorax gibbosus TaxID=931172 RepID=A0AAV6U560_9ARAC|nr:hypothetical protein JTE90_004007 [Oedothorax gibbosus]